MSAVAPAPPPLDEDVDIFMGVPKEKVKEVARAFEGRGSWLGQPEMLLYTYCLCSDPEVYVQKAKSWQDSMGIVSALILSIVAPSFLFPPEGDGSVLDKVLLEAKGVLDAISVASCAGAVVAATIMHVQLELISDHNSAAVVFQALIKDGLGRYLFIAQNFFIVGAVTMMFAVVCGGFVTYRSVSYSVAAWVCLVAVAGVTLTLVKMVANTTLRRRRVMKERFMALVARLEKEGDRRGASEGADATPG
eukprot:CAMPEP_0182860992 /NCGR_PEP_ID=MMETSP0034_2-20130328/5248_1 /TAXON_ID=156128 /ORGANISM="Nephroselmis pyriformis, Strain CCMP717" /LENGTH=247 /DNA_ID=CAMNT_0024992879 /DNA_START=6 /DNA_END=745 /DNA_ORIENTATION=-